MILVKIILLQLFWLFIILYGKTIHPVWQILIALLLVSIDYIICKPKVTIGHFLFLTGLFVLAGYLNDSSLTWFNLIYKDSYQFGNLSLWIIFLAYYEQIFAKFRNMPVVFLSVVGGIGGALAYWSAAKLGAVVIIPGMENGYVISQLIFWAVFFPLSLKLYFKSDYWDSFLDKTIIFSFDKSGFIRHNKKFTEDLFRERIEGKSILVTGATGGIGSSAANSLTKLGAKVCVTGRNRQKGLTFEKQNPNSNFVSLDMANWNEVYEFAKTCDNFDYVVFNAGSMPEKLSVNENGIEFQCASQLLGHYYLLVWLKDFNKLKPGVRIVWVSSGGMYLKKLDLSSLFNNTNYEKVDTYANVKRAQVTLVEELSKKPEWSHYFIYSMHPGWVKTEGLKEALPKFYRIMSKRLRNPEEGADTILWCLLTEKAPISGGFYFDRKQVSPYISKSYSPTHEQRVELMAAINNFKKIGH